MEEVSYLEENQSRAKKCVRLFDDVVVVLAFGVFAFDFDGGYGITDCGVKWGGVSSRTRSICRFGSSNDGVCSSVSCVCGFLLKSLFDDFLGVDCLVASLYEQVGGSETVEHLV